MKKARGCRQAVNRIVEMPEVAVRITQGGGTPAQNRSWQLLWDRLLAPPAARGEVASTEQTKKHQEDGHE